MTVVIAFGHRKRVGKDTSANFLATMLRMHMNGLKIVKSGFAYELKQTSYRIYKWAGMKPPEYYEGDAHAGEREIVLPAVGKSPRQIWLEIGMAFREIYEHTWVDLFFSQPSVDVVLVTDLRFANEFYRNRQMNGFNVKIVNPRIEYTPDKADSAINDFPDSAWDWVVQNDGTLNQLHERLEVFFKALVVPRLPTLPEGRKR